MRQPPLHIILRPAWFLLAVALLSAAFYSFVTPSPAFADDPVVEPTPTAIVVEWPTIAPPTAVAEEPTVAPGVEEPTSTVALPDTPTPTPTLVPIQTELPALPVAPVVPAAPVEPTSLPSNQWGAIVTVIVPATGTATPTPIPPTETSTLVPTETITGTPTPSWYPPGPECSVKPGKVVMQLDVPFIHQVNDITGADGNWACGPTSVAMILAYYGKLDPWPTEKSAHDTSPGTQTLASTTPTGSQYAPYVTEVFTTSAHIYSALASDPQGHPVAGLYGAICPTGLADWGLVNRVLEWNGLSTQHVALSFEGVKAALKRGHPVLIGNNLTAAGHVLVAIGYTANNQVIVNDPYGNRFSSGYGATNGQHLYYAWDCMRATNALEVIGVYPPPPTITPTPGPTDTATITPTSTDTPQATSTSKPKPSPSRTSQVAGLTNAIPTATAIPTITRTAAPKVETLVASSSTEPSVSRLSVGITLIVLATLAVGSAGFWLVRFDRALNRSGRGK